MIASQHKTRPVLILLFFSLIILSPVIASVKLPSFFSDNMVLQQQTDAAIWGWAKANATVQVVASWNKKKYAVKTGADGKWKTKISTPAAGGPYEITISEGNTITLRNVLIGEVWFCSGQSNMEMPMKGFKDQPILGSNDAVFNSVNNNIRIYTVPRSVQNEPQDTSKHSSWKAAKPEDISNFSATAYYFGRILYQQLKVPVALINDSYGGSPAEAFMSRESLKDFPDIKIHAPGSTEKLNNKNATTLYNGMIRPITGYTIKGCIWYQGESNNGRPDEYEKLFPAMVSLWRSEWGQGNFPFYFAQIAPYTYSTYSSGSWNEKMNSAYLRDAQR
ncbi:MAG: sialate O-acetylesterase, partial [Chitinophagaceae bacterium]|nr:sialate O-acetylesterase [Chitinophagaceae bacterium]